MLQAIKGLIIATIVWIHVVQRSWEEDIMEMFQFNVMNSTRMVKVILDLEKCSEVNYFLYVLCDFLHTCDSIDNKL